MWPLIIEDMSICNSETVVYKFFLILSDVTPGFTRKTECISYVRQDQNFTHMIDNRV
jgi:hypothetical protein